jgi:hypothetical protein
LANNPAARARPTSNEANTLMKTTAFAATAFAALAVVVAAQGPATPAVADLEARLSRFFETATQYAQTFRNLTVEETRVIEEFDDSGRVKKRREIVADLVLYRPARDGEVGGAEYRDVRLVDGKAVAQRGKRALDLITRAMNSASVAEELRLISRESLRYEFRWHVGNFVVSQLHRPESVLRNDFRFNRVGPTRINGHDVIEIEYREVVPRSQQPGIDRIYKAMGITSFFERGRLWLDATTSQARRSRFEIAGAHPALPMPVQLLGIESTYVDSRFGIGVPERIVAEFYENRKSKAKPLFGLTARTTYTYGAFKRFGVTTDETVLTPADR